MKSIGERIRALRVALGLSQRQLEGPGVTYTYISRLEAGQRQPSEHVLRALADKLGTTAHYLETGSEQGHCPHCRRNA